MLLVKKLFRTFDRRPAETLPERIAEQLVFRKSSPLTIGIECEFGLVDAATCQPAHVALEIVNALNTPSVQHELYQHMIEITSGVCNRVQEAERDLSRNLAAIRGHLPARGAAIVGAGSMPMLMLEQTHPVETERYAMLRRTRQALYERFTTLGMHVHIGMADTPSCIRFHNFYMHLLPHVLALSASSPFEEGRDTGFASIRPSVTESMPIGGIPYQFRGWDDYRKLCLAMARAGSITDLKDLWWDLRPCPRYGTLEIRICDQPATIAEACAIAAFIHCLGHWFSENQGWLDEMPRPDNWRMRENKWRSMRYGLDAEIVMNEGGETRPLREDIRQWLDRLGPIFDRLGYQEYRAMLEDILCNGNGAERQRSVWKATGSLEAVYLHLMAELDHGAPLWNRAGPPAGPAPIVRDGQDCAAGKQ